MGNSVSAIPNVALQLSPARSRWRNSFRSAVRNPVPVLCGAMLLFVIAVAVLANHVAPHDPYRATLADSLQGPSSSYLLGTDSIGRDVLSRLMYGGRTSLRVAAIVVVATGLIGTLIGLLSGYLGGKFDIITQRLLETFQAFPAIILALFLITIFGGGKADLAHFWRDVSLPIIVIFVPSLVRVVRASVFATKNTDYVTAAITTGASAQRIMLRHILPNVSAPILVVLSLNFGFAILIEATLGFLGFGTQLPEPSWGAMLAESRNYLETSPHLVLAPAAVICGTVFAVNILGDFLRDVLDPQLRGAR